MFFKLDEACNFIKKWFQQRCFTVKLAKFLKTLFFAKHFRWLPLNQIQLPFSKLSFKIFFLKTKLLFIDSTAKNPVISPNFLVRKFVERHRFHIVSGDSPVAETVPFHKIPHQEIRWNYGIFHSVVCSY